MWLRALYRNQPAPIQLQSSTLLRKSFVFFVVLLFLSAMLAQVGCSGATTVAAVTAANMGPSFTSQPVSQTIAAGQTATFSVTASGTAPSSDQWNNNGSAITSATTSTYTTPATTSTDNGAQFTVTITNSAGAITSNPATLTVNTPPSITAQPASQTVIVGQTATFAVTAISIAPLIYQWQKNG